MNHVKLAVEVLQTEVYVVNFTPSASQCESVEVSLTTHLQFGGIFLPSPCNELAINRTERNVRTRTKPA